MLKSFNWKINIEKWEEPLYISVDNSLKSRLLDPKRPYRKLIAKDLSSDSIDLLNRILDSLYKTELPQHLTHRKLSGVKSL